MATDREVRADAVKEYEQLCLAWQELFNEGPDEVVELRTTEDAWHPPVALSTFMIEMIDENHDSAQKKIEEELLKGTIREGSPEHFQLMVACLAQMTKLIGVRMFHFGQYVSATVPYDGMVPCMCKVLTDDKIAAELSQHMDLEGDGWIIPNFWADKEGGEE